MVIIDHAEELEGKVVIIEITGSLSSETSASFEEYVEKLLGMGKSFIILNGHNLKYVTSDGIGLMLYVQKKISQHNGYFVIYDLADEIKSLYNLLGFTKVFDIADSRSEAFEIIKKQMGLRAGGGPSGESMQASSPSTPAVDAENSPDTPAKKTTPLDAVGLEFESPLVVECAECKGLIRIKKSGNYLCPDCHAEFTVEGDQTIIF